MGWKTFNDRLALFLLLIIPVLWLVQAIAKTNLDSAVNGALIVTWTLVVQYYFRRSPPDTPAAPLTDTPPPTPTPAPPSITGAH